MSKEPELIAYAANMEIKYEEPQNAGVWFKAVKAFFDDLTTDLKKPGVVIGHIKGFLELNNGAYAYLSNAGNQQGTDMESQGEGETESGKLGFNVLLYGAGEDLISVAVEKSMAKMRNQLPCQYLLEEAHK